MTQISIFSGAAEQSPERVQGFIGRGFLSLADWAKRHPGWIILTLVAVAYYHWFGRGSDTAPFYADAGRCILRGEPLLVCLPPFPYQPALAVFF